VSALSADAALDGEGGGDPPDVAKPVTGGGPRPNVVGFHHVGMFLPQCWNKTDPFIIAGCSTSTRGGTVSLHLPLITYAL
jgi:hypothetical protein